MPTVISVENLSKVYRLGQIGTGTFARDLNVWWAKQRGKPNPMLRIGETDHVNRVGEEIWALKDVSFSVEQGEVLGIIGRNGAGKSTLLKILSRITAPTRGVIRGTGRVASLLEVGTGFHPELTGRENIYLNGAILGMSRLEIDRKFDEIVDFSGVEKFIDTPVKRYSSGMYVRLAFAVAAHLDPEILVVDEVLAVGDAEFQKKCLGKMGEVAREGRTVLFVSHNMAAIQTLCDKSLILKDGRNTDPLETRKAIGIYMGGAKALNGRWTNSEELIRKGLVLASAAIQQDGREVDMIRMTAPFDIRFELSPLASDRDCLFSINITDSQNTVIYHSMDVYNGEPLDAARLGTRIMRIPAYGLAGGEYHLSYWLGHPKEGIWDHAVDILTWTVQSDCPIMIKWPESVWKGIVGPGLAHWKHEPANSSNDKGQLE
jgi:lipopolysaccharide transport system ATP-binding protein